MNYSVPRIIDSLLSKFIFFMPGALIGGYFCRSVADVLIFALIFALCTSEIYLEIISSGSGKKRKHGKEYDQTRNAFIYRSDDFALDFMCDALKQKHDVKRGNGFAVVDGVALICRITLAPLTGDALVDMCASVKSEGLNKAVVLTDKSDATAQIAAQNIADVNVRVLEFDEVYRLIKALRVAPPTAPEKPKEKRSKKQFFLSCISRKRANAYLFAAAVLFIASRFVAYSLYYIVTSAVLLVISCIARFNKNDEKN